MDNAALVFLLPILMNILSGLVVYVITDFDHFFEKRKISPQIRRVVVSGSIIISSLGIFFSILLFAPRTPKAGNIFSDFENGNAINNYDCHWSCFDDGIFQGNSTISRNILSRKEHEKVSSQDDLYYLEIKYNIKKNPRIDKPYCGVLSGFSPKSIHCRDVSSYTAISFQAWHEGNIPPGVRFQLEITPTRWFPGYEPGGKLLYDFTDDTGISSERKVRIPFSLIVNKSKTGNEINFSNHQLQKEIQQIAVVITGDQGDAQGRVCLDNIEFVK